MKKLLLLISFVGLALWSKAQSTTYHAFKFDIGLGYAIPSENSGGGTKAGVTFTLQPHYRLSDDLALGLRFEGAGLGYENTAAGDTKAKVQLLYSYCATGEYYFASGSFRPFVGAGAGFFQQSSVSVDSNDPDNSNTALVSGGTKFGFFPEVGF